LIFTVFLCWLRNRFYTNENIKINLKGGGSPLKGNIFEKDEFSDCKATTAGWIQINYSPSIWWFLK